MGKSAGEGERYIQSVFRALKIMEYVAEIGNDVGLLDISKRIDLSKSTAHGLIATLVQFGYMSQNPRTGKYSLGLKLFELGQAYMAHLDLREIALPYLKELSADNQETIHIAVLSGEEVVYIDKVDGPLSIGIRSQIGGRNPAYCTGVGKVLLSGLSDDQIEAMYHDKVLKKYTENTIIDLSELIACLHTVRQTGYASDMEEIEIGLRCVAAPLKDSSGTVIAAISLSGPASRLVDTKLDDIAANLLRTAMKISARLGYKD